MAPAFSVSRPASGSPDQVSRVAAWDWRDGPIEGLLQLAGTDDVYLFRLLEERLAEADDNDVRIFGLYPVAVEHFDKFVDTVGAVHQPRWPIWWPVWKFPSEQVLQEMNSLVDEIKESADALAWIVAAPSSFSTLRAFPVVEHPIV